MASRIVFHVDLDAFFASCEELRRPELRGRALVVGGDPRNGEGRGIVTTANYEARKFGLRSGMPVSRAWRLCPEAVFVRPDFDYYSGMARRAFDDLRARHPVLERASIDEAYIDATQVCSWSGAADFAAGVQRAVAAATGGLSASLGAGPNKLVAKIASDFRKPRGVTVVPPDEVQAFLDPLGVRRIPGIGPKTEPALAALGVRTIRDLRTYDPRILEERFGSQGAWMARAARGESDSPVQSAWEPSKSVGAERTYMEDTRSPAVVRATLRRLMSDLEDELGDAYWWKTVTLKVRYADFHTISRQASLPRHARDTAWARREVLRLLEGALADPRPVRLVGLRFGELAYGVRQRELTPYLGAPRPHLAAAGAG